MPRWFLAAMMVAALVATIAITDDWGSRPVGPVTCPAAVAPPDEDRSPDRC